MIYDFICDELYVPMKLKELAILMQVPKRDRAELTRVMDALVEDGKVELTKKGKYIKSEKKYETGVFTSHPKGFGFVTIEGMDEDIFIPAGTGERSHAHGYRAACHLSDNRRKTQRGNDHKDPFPRYE